jgi:hypothetical protein
MHLTVGGLHDWIRAGRHDSCPLVQITIGSEKIFGVDEFGVP